MNTAQNEISEHGILTPLTKKLCQHLKFKFLALMSKIYDGSELNSCGNYQNLLLLGLLLKHEQPCFRVRCGKIQNSKFKILYF